MPTVAVWLRIDGARVAEDVRGAWEKLHGSDGEVLLDFSSVHRVDASAVAAIERLATQADEKSVKVVLRGVNVEVYKVMKLMNLSPRFSFISKTVDGKRTPIAGDESGRGE